MNNEFYKIEFECGEDKYFKNKDKAFDYLWQSFLNDGDYSSDEEINAARNELNEFYYIDGFAWLKVLGFVD